MKPFLKFIWVLLSGIAVWGTQRGFSATLTLEQIFASALENNQQLKAATAALEQARALKKEAGRRLFPTISLNANVTQSEHPGYQSLPPALTGGSQMSFFPERLYKFSFDVDQPIYRGGRIWSALRRRELQQAKAEWDQKGVKQKVFAEILQTAWKWSAQNEKWKVLKESKDRQKEFVRLTRRRLRAGNAREYELLQGEADLISYGPRMSEVEESQITLKESLVVLAGLQPRDTFPESFFFLSDKTPRAELKGHFLEVSRQNNPELRSAQLATELAVVNKAIQLGEHYPSVSVRGSYGWSTPERSEIGSGEAQTSTLSLVLNVPLFSGLTSVQLRRAGQMGIRVAEAGYRSSLDRQRVRIAGGRLALVASGNRLTQSRQWHQKTKKALHEVIESYEVGLTSNLQVVQLQASRERAALAEIGARLDYHQKFLDWKLALGQSIEEWAKGLAGTHRKGP